MHVLVTGGAGFIGSHLVERFLDFGESVYVVDNLSTGRRSNVPETDPDRGFVFRHGAIDDFVSLVQGPLEPDLIVHAAASYDDPTNFERDVISNVAGSIDVAKYAKNVGAKLVYFQTALPPISSYAISKIAAQHYIEMLCPDALIFRLANVYGPRNLSGPIPTFYKRMNEGDDLVIAQTRRDLLFIDDLVAGVLAAIGADANGVFDMNSGREHTIFEIAMAVATALETTFEYEELPPGGDDVARMTFDPTRARDELDWFPSTDLRDGVARAVAWYGENGVGRTYTHLALKGGTR